MDNPIEMWSALQKLHEQDNPAARFNAFDEFFNISKQEDETLQSLVSRVEHALHKIRSTRKDTLTLSQFEKELAYIALIRALPEEYSSFRSALLLLADFSLKTLKEAFMQEQMNRQKRAAEQSIAMKVTTASPKPSSHSAQNSSAQSRCDFCGMKNHTEANCFKRRDAIKALKQNRKQGNKKGKEKAHAI